MLNLFAATGHIRYTKSARYMFNGEIARGPKLAVKKTFLCLKKQLQIGQNLGGPFNKANHEVLKEQRRIMRPKTFQNPQGCSGFTVYTHLQRCHATTSVIRKS